MSARIVIKHYFTEAGGVNLPLFFCNLLNLLTFSGGNGESPRSKRKILRNFKIFLPKFHFILPNFYFPAPWRIFVCSVEIPNFLGRKRSSYVISRGKE